MFFFFYLLFEMRFRTHLFELDSESISFIVSLHLENMLVVV